MNLSSNKSVDLKYATKWLFYFVLIGIIAGLGAVLFHYLCGLGMHYFMDAIAGYRPGSPAGEHLLLPHTDTPFNRWLLLILPALGGLYPGGWCTPSPRKPKGTVPTLPSTPITIRAVPSVANSHHQNHCLNHYPDHGGIRRP